jgi:beta-glucosidase
VDIKQIINELTLEEKASLCTGKNLWETQNIDRLRIPSITFANGPNGLAKRTSDFTEAVPSTCFLSPSALSSSWDVDLAYTIGKAIGEECSSEGVNVLLGPAINIQRSPLGGRNFEYYSEDPVLSGEIGAAFIKGIQSKGVGACVKHLLANNQEHHRHTINNIIDNQALDEIYLRNFEIAIKDGKPYVIMAAHNSVDGVPCTENKFLLTDILRDRWNFDGFVVSDWYAVNSIIDALKAGLDLEMPYSYGIDSKTIVEAVLTGALDVSILNNAVEGILNVVFKVTRDENERIMYDKEKHNDLAREAAENSIVLLKNKHNLLPLKRDKLKNKKIAIIGDYAKNPRYQGRGSSHVTPTMIENAYDEIRKLAQNSIKLYYAKGYNTSDEDIDEDDDSLLKEARKIAKESDISILFLGTPDSSDIEDRDKTTIKLPDNQIRLIKEVSKVQPNIIVILSNGSPIIMSPWAKYADAILESWLPGQAGGGAIADILFGIVTPSGKLSSTFPIKLSDNPTYLDYISPNDNLEYKEGIFIGYRYYDKKDKDVEFPFGFGLSYTIFNYSNLTLSKNVIKDTDILEVKLKVKNAGKYFGKEVVELYVKNVVSSTPRPVKELKAFTKIDLFPGEEKEVTLTLNFDDFSHYDLGADNLVVESGPYEILIGKSSRDIVLSKNIYVQSSFASKVVYTENTLIEDFFKNPKSKPIIEPLLQNAMEFLISDKNDSKEFIVYLKNMPIKKLILLTQGKFTIEMLNELLKSLNE